MSGLPPEETEGTTTEEQSERHASNLELFLDLVFVFAVTRRV